VGFHVADLHATTGFYRLLGLAVPATADAPIAAATATGPTGTDLTLTWGTSAARQQLAPGSRVACTAALTPATPRQH
jgi:hypothetical protein